MNRPRYMSYLLRLWETRDGEEMIWHASLECLGSRTMQGFADPEDLFDFLRVEMASGDGCDSQEKENEE